MNVSKKKGFSFGLTSGIITTLGLIVGLNAGTHSRTVILGAILIIAFADSLSDSFGMHMSEESANKKPKQVWQSTFTTFISKIFFTSTFMVPILLLPLKTAIFVSVTWGILLLTLFSIYLAKREKIKPFKVILEHLGIAAFVLIVTDLMGSWIGSLA